VKYKIYNQDVIKWAREYQKGKFHALISDAPYHLTSITKRFGKNGSAPAKFGSDGAFQRASKGFMGTQWDGGDIAFRPDTWSALGEHLFPGAFGMVFSASRNWHRLAVAIEDAGFIIHPTIFLWNYSQGFPKATNIIKQLDDDWATKNYGGWCDCDDDCNTP
jgi:site-specific DNA-methyltransferase (adenine-specific)